MKNIKKILKPLVEKFPIFSLTYRTLRDRKDLFLQPDMTSLGFRFKGNQAMERGLFEPYETELVKKVLPKIDVLVNIGANIGYYVCHALQAGKKVIAFEPMELNIQYLLRNIKANEWQNDCEIMPIAVSNAVGIIEIYGGGTGASLVKGWAGIAESYKTLVPCSTVDCILGNRLDGKKVFVIVDIEGAEDMMLEGASNLLDMHPKPIWLVEISGEEHQPQGIKINPNLLATFEKFWSRGYESITADNLLRKITKEEVNHILRTQVDTLGTHNFLFYETGENLFQGNTL
ncbi:FkbM family methyltransferase [Polynucleobacter paneuropaeus]|nr:FkbM family methyltransferase [Polynucleobacter paneuropaeus]MBT8544376.1 FkbM family methyltransferase [Polynucleobacter paneuropaeus]MBT8555562.1 FkbM family methyltransferase [Polynucleobacter paneuropaeus]MBT8560838.1 FkbM family methyltransferase [Polynucleobacter paneuropaeus]